MKTVVATLALLLGAAGVASAQDERKMDELKREFDRTMKALQEKYEQERGAMERMFRAQMERLKKSEHKDGERREDEKKPRSTEELLQRVLERLDHLEKRLDQELPRFEFKKLPFENLPKFDFKRFEDFKDLAPYWREFAPKFKDEQYRFEFKKKGGEDDDDDKKSEKKDEKKEKGKKEKKDKDDDKKKY